MTGAGEGAVVVVLGTPSDAQRQALRPWNSSFVGTGADLSAGRLPDPRRNAIVWLSPRALPDDRLREEIGRFVRGAGRGVALAEHVVESGDASASLGMRAIAAHAGAARLSADGPIGMRGATIVRLSGRVRIAAPSRVGEHLEAINRESSAAASVGRFVGDRPRWKSLALTPLVGSAGGWWRARGDRRRAFTLAFVESFGAAAAAIKLWELLETDEEPPA